MLYDVVVVGAGPAGAITAYQLASHGLSVRLIDKASFPRYKPCGGGLTFKAFTKIPFDITPIIDLQAKGGRVTFRGKKILEVNTNPPIAWLVTRDRFDQYLVDQAIYSGSSFSDEESLESIDYTKHYITVNTNKGRINTRILVGADGVYSKVARISGLIPKRQTGLALEAEVSVPNSTLERQGAFATFDFGIVPHGYSWIFPKIDHLSVGVFHARQGKFPEIRKYLSDQFAFNPILLNNKVTFMQGHHIPLGNYSTPINKGPILLVGDAANLADPWLGEGLYYAINSARIASKIIISAFEKGNFDLNNYSQLINREIMFQFKHARIFAKVVYKWPKIGSHLLQRSKTLQKIIFGTMRGEIKFSQLTSSLIFKSAIILLQSINP